MEYKLAMAPTKPEDLTDEDGNEYAITYVRAITRIVSDHFAVRLTFSPHQSGADIFVPVYLLDHIPSGYKVYAGSNGGGAGAEECVRFAKSIATIPIDWSSDEPFGPDGTNQYPEHGRFQRAASLAAMKGDGPLDFETWLKEEEQNHG